jgi:hypothetical protein
MKTSIGFLVGLLVVVACSVPAVARERGERGERHEHGDHARFFFGFDAFPPYYPYYYPPPAYYYPPPAYYAPPVYAAPAPAQNCRQFNGDASMDASGAPFYGTACLQADGRWHIVN